MSSKSSASKQLVKHNTPFFSFYFYNDPKITGKPLSVPTPSWFNPRISQYGVVIANILILYYLFSLESKDCDCKNNWRHNFIKGYTIFAISLTVLMMILSASVESYKYLTIICQILFFIALYALITYIFKLNENKCDCANEKHPYLNKFIKIMIICSVILLLIAVLNSVF